jgi:hypothetical protein
MFTRGGRYAGATLLTLISGICIIASFRQAHWWVSILCLVIGVGIPLAIAGVMPSEQHDGNRGLLHRSYWSRVGFSYVYVAVIAVALMLILPLLGLALFEFLAGTMR